MINHHSVIAIVPARGGSKGLPGKNIRNLCGKPLIAWTIEAAKSAKYLDTVVVTTDSLDIAAVAKEYGAEVPFIRPHELASDYTPTIDVVYHALKYYREALNQEFDYVVLLEPTSPLRENDDIDRMLELLVNRAKQCDAIVSVGEVSEHPSIMKRLVRGDLEPFCVTLSQTTRRQDNTAAYFPYGVAYIVKTSVLFEEGTFYVRRSMPFLIKRYQNYEIDDIYDLLCVENIMKYEWGVG